MLTHLIIRQTQYHIHGNMCVCLFGLRLYVPVNNFSVMFRRFPGLKQYLAMKILKVSCSRTQHRAPGEIRTHDLAVKSGKCYMASRALQTIHLEESYQN